jgi:excisionase family DNA binding protein
VVVDGTWLTIGEVIAALRAAGYTESESTVRRMIDDGELESYRTERGGHRRVKATAVAGLIEQRRTPGV